MSETEHSRLLNVLWDQLADVVPAACMQDDYELLVESLGNWPDLFAGSGWTLPSEATLDAMKLPAIRKTVEAILAIERTWQS